MLAASARTWSAPQRAVNAYLHQVGEAPTRQTCQPVPLYHPGTSVRPPAAAAVRGRSLFGPLLWPSHPFLFGPAAQRSPKPLATMLNWGCQSPGSAKRCSINVPSLGLASRGPTSVGVCMPCLSPFVPVCLSLPPPLLHAPARRPTLLLLGDSNSVRILLPPLPARHLRYSVVVSRRRQKTRPSLASSYCIIHNPPASGKRGILSARPAPPIHCKFRTHVTGSAAHETFPGPAAEKGNFSGIRRALTLAVGLLLRSTCPSRHCVSGPCCQSLGAIRSLFQLD